MRDFTSVGEARTWLQTIGAVGNKIRGGIQIDVNVAFRNVEEALQEASLCDHNCTTEGGNYDCPAAFTLPGNRGLKKSTMAPADVLANWIITASIGLGQAISDFLEVHFNYFCQTSNITNIMVKQALWLMLIEGKIEVNLFGGNPEMHPEIARLIGLLKDHGLVVNLTTTGRRWLADPNFAKSLVGIEPSVLALSLDDLEIPELLRLSTMTTAQIRNEWRQINPLHGQQQKAHEAVAVLRHYQEDGGYPNTMLLNMVLHAGNLETVDEMFEAVEKCAPWTRLNPYADQTAFQGKLGSFGPREIRLFELFED